MISAIILAAGKSERMGRPKALLPAGGETFLELLIRRVRSSQVQSEVVVLGHHRDEILREAAPEHWVYNERYQQGMTSSFQEGIRGLPRGAGGALLFLVDHPAPEARTIEALVEAFVPGGIVVPVYQGSRGHPVLFSRAVLDEVLALPEDRGANSVVRARPERVVEIEVDDAAVVTDIDTPGEFSAWIRMSGKSR